MPSDSSASVGLKWGIVSAIFVLTMVAGCLPIWVLPLIRRKASSKASLIVACLSSFSGGVFLGVCMCDMIPDALEGFDRWKEVAKVDTAFPWVLFGAAVGFFVVYMIDGVTTILLKNKAVHKETKSRAHTACSIADATQDEVLPPMQRRLTINVMHNHAEHFGSFSLVLALLLHVTIEGFALGVQPSTSSFITLFIGIALHKGLVIFSTGMKLLKGDASLRMVVGMILALAFFSFLGGVAGILLQNGNFDHTAKLFMTTLLTCFSAGTFLYITFFEILGEASGHIIERLSAVFGFMIISVVLYFL